MIISKVTKTNPKTTYSLVNNEIIFNADLSTSAKGLLSFLLSIPANKKIQKKDLKQYFTDGYYSIDSAFKELVDRKYIQKIELRSEKGRFIGYDFEVYDSPKKIKKEVRKIVNNLNNPKSVKVDNPEKLLNQIFIEDCQLTMLKMPNAFVDLVVCSPPYNEIRKYHGNHDFDFENIAKELHRIIKKHGVLVWVVGDETYRGSETATSFKQAIYLKEVCGFNLHDTMIFEKNGSAFPANKNGHRYTQIFEYMFVFSKGKPKTCNLISDKQNRWEGWTNWGKKTQRNNKDEIVETTNINPVPEFSPRNNIWRYATGAGYGTKDKIAHEHPAIFPDKLAEDHILSWSNEGDIVYDPFAGSGTTLKMAKLLNRKYIGSEKNKKYKKIIENRIRFILR